MKKNNFIDGAIISTLCLIACKILGLIYVIPFYQIIGSQGGALYSYAYSIYAIFLNLSTVGIPTAISKIISEYDTKSFMYLKDRAFKLAKKMLTIVGLISFIIMFFFSKNIANGIIGGVTGGNSVESVSIAIKTVSLALLIVPRLSILKGYFQGNRYLLEGSVSSIIEQAVRVAIIIFGSLIIVKVFNLSIDVAVYVAVFAATVGALVSYLYLKKKATPLIKQDELVKITDKEKSISDKTLIKKIIIYAIPFVIISMLQSAYNAVDTFTVVKTLTNIGFSTEIAETTIGVISTWGSKINMIVVSISIGITSSLIPNVVGSYTRGDFKDINDKTNLTFKMLTYLTIPMAFGISFLSEPIWHIFYGIDVVSVNIFKYYILQVIFYGLFTTLIYITQSMNQSKLTIGSLLLSFVLKIILNIPMMYLLNYMGINSYYGPIVTDILTTFISLIFVLIILKKKYNFTYKTLYPFITKVIISLLVMLGVLYGLKYLYFDNSSITGAVLTTALYTVVGGCVYFFISSRFKLLNEILGDNYLSKFKSIIKK